MFAITSHAAGSSLLPSSGLLARIFHLHLSLSPSPRTELDRNNWLQSSIWTFAVENRSEVGMDRKFDSKNAVIDIIALEKRVKKFNVKEKTRLPAESYMQHNKQQQ